MRMLLNHRVGLPAIRKKLNDDDMYNWDTMAAALAAQEPVVGTRDEAWLPCADDRVSDRRSDAAHYRQECRFPR